MSHSSRRAAEWTSSTASRIVANGPRHRGRRPVVRSSASLHRFRMSHRPWSVRPRVEDGRPCLNCRIRAVIDASRTPSYCQVLHSVRWTGPFGLLRDRSAGIDQDTRDVPPRVRFPWYDSKWLSSYVQARSFLAHSSTPRSSMRVRAGVVGVPHRAEVPPVQLDRVFDDQVLDRDPPDRCRRTRWRSWSCTNWRSFGRFVVHDDPFFVELQYGVVDLVSRLGRRRGGGELQLPEPVPRAMHVAPSTWTPRARSGRSTSASTSHDPGRSRSATSFRGPRPGNRLPASGQDEIRAGHDVHSVHDEPRRGGHLRWQQPMALPRPDASGHQPTTSARCCSSTSCRRDRRGCRNPRTGPSIFDVPELGSFCGPRHRRHWWS